MKEDYLTLKWGSLKAWNLSSDKAKKLLEEYFSEGVSMSAIAQHDNPRQKEIICELIDECKDERIFLDWDDKYITKKEAKKYVTEY